MMGTDDMMGTNDKMTFRKHAALISTQITDHLFPERQIHIRTDGNVRYISLSKNIQIIIATAIFIAFAWSGFATYKFQESNSIISTKDSQIANGNLSYNRLLNEMASNQKRFSSLSIDLEKNIAVIDHLSQKNNSLERNLSSVSQKLLMTESERQTIQKNRERLRSNLAKFEQDMRSMANRNFKLEGNLDNTVSDLQAALAERNQAIFKSNDMQRKVIALKSTLAKNARNQKDTIGQLLEKTTGYISSLKNVVKTAGLKPDRLIYGNKKPPTGSGGPFIPANVGDVANLDLKTSLINLRGNLSYWEALQDVMKKLPITSPLDSYYITSTFGKRRDPVNKRWSSHYGLDMGAAFNTRIFAPAPGTVVYAGWKGKYGKYIEIDHGSGVRTRYGHLNKILVKKGQKVSFRDKIGLVGSTGRSTGSHLHYETIYRGKAQNPANFFKAGRYVFKNQ